ncbi:hypothetical protein, partial [Mycoplasma testudineum]|uniref:hypothetical protein n=1 Tax=Mycoplasma testudineum TaxID=244584 RepID=UPI000B9EF3E9
SYSVAAAGSPYLKLSDISPKLYCSQVFADFLNEFYHLPNYSTKQSDIYKISNIPNEKIKIY